ncbi:uncharacterized protein METZ01_LOCUS320196 [marine metagenome]|uniref:Uncharacterized protein n=1 Tax=marine metagenome TaxID=408172 RepID=A0A382P607_9ZZZZ
MFFKSELQRTLNNADDLSASDKLMIGKFIDGETMSPYHGDMTEGLKERLSQATLNRQNAISSLEEKDPNWVKWALLESYYAGSINEKKDDVMAVLNWVCDNR